MHRVVTLTLFAFAAPCRAAQAQGTRPVFTHADTLRGSNGPGARVVGRGVLRSARRRQPGRQHHPRLQRDHLPRDQAGEGDADRPAGAARGRQHGPGRPARCSSAATATRSSSRSPRRSPRRRQRPITVYYHGKPRAATAPALGRRLHLAHRQPRQPVDRDGQRGTRRQRVVAEQGLSRRRAGQPARRDHGARLDDGRLERPAAHRRRTTPTARRPTSGSSASRSTTTTSRSTPGTTRTSRRRSTARRAR